MKYLKEFLSIVLAAQVKGMLYAIANVELSLSKNSPNTISYIFQIFNTKILYEFKLLSIEVSLQNDDSFSMFDSDPPYMISNY